ncbi:MAG: hypothetical protein FWF49_01945 [Oscillospiraceae bacterium]|nr:hypothetical protein [Oscillospiraceae bacterium]
MSDECKECKECKEFVQTLCPVTGTQKITICVPVTVKGTAKIGDVMAKCDGPAEVIHGMDKCPEPPDEEAKFIIKQKITVEVPMVCETRTYVSKSIMHDDEDCESDGDMGGQQPAV